jgi:hypothetical protein
MPIRINLLADAQAAEELRRKDPVKRALYAAGCLVVLVGLWTSTLQFKIMAARGELNSLDSKWLSIEKGYQAAVESQRSTIETEQKLAALENMTTNRFLWGTVLNAFQRTLDGVEDVQVNHLRTEQAYFVTEGTPPRTNDIQIIPGRPAGATERVQITIDATDSTAGGRVVNKFKESILAVPYFKEHLTRTNGVLLTQRGAPSVGKSGGGQVVNFTLQCYFPEKTR